MVNTMLADEMSTLAGMCEFEVCVVTACPAHPGHVMAEADMTVPLHKFLGARGDGVELGLLPVSGAMLLSMVVAQTVFAVQSSRPLSDLQIDDAGVLRGRHSLFFSQVDHADWEKYVQVLGQTVVDDAARELLRPLAEGILSLGEYTLVDPDPVSPLGRASQEEVEAALAAAPSVPLPDTVAAALLDPFILDATPLDESGSEVGETVLLGHVRAADVANDDSLPVRTREALTAWLGGRPCALGMIRDIQSQGLPS